ncbi:hypothetical protein BDN72DRAFT_837193 [Pluteus cervinus]|uniref:Uncharacterized protein n=1 Tax=Pluteus cervinus TaxID=181527 RepID=A0ACD3B1F9_9AGAR|nr:hypothetical protein BDN72DRAFT_837193 [Pluteus cervinus]
MLFLHEARGKFPVGATTFVTPARPARTIGTVKRVLPDGKLEPALKLEEVAFTAYYPANTDGARKGIDWVLRPMRDSLQGFVHFAGVPRWILWPLLYLFGSLIKVPVYNNAPLLDPRKVNAEKERKQWPLVIFSHGLGGSRTAYSQICSRLAASGKVVLAIEHRDGTGHACLPRSWNSEGDKSQPTPLWYLRDVDVTWEDGSDRPPTPFPLRTDQLVFRNHEVHTAYEQFCRFVKKESDVQLEAIDGAPIDGHSWSILDELSGLPPVRWDREVALTGHSFGGCTVLSMLSNETLPEYKPIPVTHALLLDPWLEPLPTPGPVPLLRDSSSNAVDVESDSSNTLVISAQADGKPSPRMLVINSEIFTLWRDHFPRLQEVVKAWEPSGNRIVTLIGSKHADFSDFPALPVVRSKASSTFLDIIGRLSTAFLEDQIDHALTEVPSQDLETKVVGVRKDGKPRRKIIGEVGKIIIS